MKFKNLKKRIFLIVFLAMILSNCRGYVSPIHELRMEYQAGNKDKVEAFLNSEDPLARQEAIKIIAKMGNCPAKLFEMRKDKDIGVRSTLATSLQVCNNEEALNILLVLAKDQSAMVRKATPYPLINNDYCRSECQLSLRELLNDRDSFVKLSAAGVLYQRFPKESHSVVVDSLSSKLIVAKEEALRIIPLFKNRDDVYYLAEFLNASDETLRILSRRAIEDILGRPLSGAEYVKLTQKDPISIKPKVEGKENGFDFRDKKLPLSAESKNLVKDYGLQNTGKIDKDSIAVIIGNRDYSSVDIPKVAYAIRDAMLIRTIAMEILGIKEENIIYIENAKFSDFNKIFGTATERRGKLANWANEKSKILIYYSGHGAPDIQSREGYFVPVDSDINYMRLSGYPVKQLLENVSEINMKNATIIIDACFSGISHAGTIIQSASPVYINASPMYEIREQKLTLLYSSKADEISSWDENKSHGLFTYYFVKSLKDGDANKDGKISIGEMKEYLSKNVPLQAKKLMNREQNPVIIGVEGNEFFE